MTRAGLSWRLRDRTLDLGPRTLVMGVVNVTPDSFSDGGRFISPGAALDQALKLVREGADLIDIGGESTRPGSAGVGPEEELQRVIPVIEGLAGRVGTPISIDTRKAAVARAALNSGASIINDISGGLADPELLSLAAQTGAGLILMHMRGEPATMQTHARYDDLLGEIEAELSQRVEGALRAGVAAETICLDPGIGFAKLPEHNLLLIRELSRLSSLGFPLLAGPSRKFFIGRALEEQGLPAGPDDRLEGTLAAVTLCALAGAHLVRVHDVAPTRRSLAVADAVRNGGFISVD